MLHLGIYVSRFFILLNNLVIYVDVFGVVISFKGEYFNPTFSWVQIQLPFFEPDNYLI